MSFNVRDFRRALGRFPTGVTVIAEDDARCLKNSLKALVDKLG